MALSKLAVKRLTKLADFMDSLPKSANKHFNMASYLEHDSDDHDHGLRRKKELAIKDLYFCGTSACALGWASTVPSFRRAGLTMDGNGQCRILGRGRWRWNTDIAEEFFDLPSHSTSILFGLRPEIKTPKQWARHCRNFIKENA